MIYQDGTPVDSVDASIVPPRNACPGSPVPRESRPPVRCPPSSGPGVEPGPGIELARTLGLISVWPDGRR
jgi:hypothetical protein